MADDGNIAVTHWGDVRISPTGDVEQGCGCCKRCWYVWRVSIDCSKKWPHIGWKLPIEYIGVVDYDALFGGLPPDLTENAWTVLREDKWYAYWVSSMPHPADGTCSNDPPAYPDGPMRPPVDGPNFAPTNSQAYDDCGCEILVPGLNGATITLTISEAVVPEGPYYAGGAYYYYDLGTIANPNGTYVFTYSSTDPMTGEQTWSGPHHFDFYNGTYKSECDGINGTPISLSVDWVASFGSCTGVAALSSYMPPPVDRGGNYPVTVEINIIDPETRTYHVRYTYWQDVRRNPIYTCGIFRDFYQAEPPFGSQLIASPGTEDKSKRIVVDILYQWGTS